MQEVVLLLGSNLGDTEYNINLAITNIEKQVGKVTKKSKILKTLPVEFVSTQIFCNIAVILYTNLSPIQLLNELKNIEISMGRKEDSKVLGEYSDRIIDIDIVDYDGISFYAKRLEIPHYKHKYQRDFSRELLEEINCLK